MNKKFISGILTLALAAGVCPAGLAESSDSEERLAHRLQEQITVPYNRDGFATREEIQNKENYGEDKKPLQTGKLYSTFLPNTSGKPTVSEGGSVAFITDTLDDVEAYDRSAGTVMGKEAVYKIGDVSGAENVYAAKSGGIEIERSANKLAILMAAGSAQNAVSNTSIGRIEITYKGEKEGETTTEYKYFLVSQVSNVNPVNSLYKYDSEKETWVQIDDTDKADLSGKTYEDMSLNCVAANAEVLTGAPLAFGKTIKRLHASYTSSSNEIDAALCEIVVDVDPTKVISKIEIMDGNSCGRFNELKVFNCIDREKTPLKPSENDDKAVACDETYYASAYLPVKIEGVNDVYYLKADRNGAATLGVTAMSETLADRVKAADGKIANLTEYSADVWNEVRALIDEGALESDFSNYAKLTELREAEVYGKRISTYADIEYDKNAYATWAEVSTRTNYEDYDGTNSDTSHQYNLKSDSPLYGRGVGVQADYPLVFLNDGKNGTDSFKDTKGWDKESLTLTTENAKYKMGNPYANEDGGYDNNVLAGTVADDASVNVNDSADKIAVLLSNTHKKNTIINKITVKYENDETEDFYVVSGIMLKKQCAMLQKKDTENGKYVPADKTDIDVSKMSLSGVKSGKNVVLANDVAWAPSTFLTTNQYGSVTTPAYLKEAVLPVDKTKTVTSVTLDVSFAEDLQTVFETPAVKNGTYGNGAWSSAYVPITVEGDNTQYYLMIARNNAGLFAVTTLSETLRERVTAANTALDTLMASADRTTEALTEIKTEIDALISEGAVKADFDKYADLEAALSTPISIAQAITSAELYDSDDNKVTALTEGEYTAKVTMAKKEDMAVILGAFDGSGNMLSAHIMTMTEASENADGSYTISDSFTVTSGTIRLTAFAFDSTANIKPLCEAKNF